MTNELRTPSFVAVVMTCFPMFALDNYVVCRNCYFIRRRWIHVYIYTTYAGATGTIASGFVKLTSTRLSLNRVNRISSFVLVIYYKISIAFWRFRMFYCNSAQLFAMKTTYVFVHANNLRAFWHRCRQVYNTGDRT